ncbi:hypothetical protein TNCT_93581 [Trichonephila clavata]|uniref:Uncharacterized protein n=1 Tax=Trichonephila clavata TaxID=2740835 RepID=A0A8X6HHC8_TRICU|nr:hypothetical protein TNCT_93581 [Trichonephila clavata]
MAEIAKRAIKEKSNFHLIYACANRSPRDSILIGVPVSLVCPPLSIVCPFTKSEDTCVRKSAVISEATAGVGDLSRDLSLCCVRRDNMNKVIVRDIEFDL